MTRNAQMLTPKQAQVWKLLEQGKTVPEVAKAMKTKPNSIYNHIRKIRALGVDVSTNSARGGKPTPRTVEDSAKNNGNLVEIDSTLDNVLTAIEAAVAAEREDSEKLLAEGKRISAEISDLERQREELTKRVRHAQTRLDRLLAAETAISDHA